MFSTYIHRTSSLEERRIQYEKFPKKVKKYIVDVVLTRNDTIHILAYCALELSVRDPDLHVVR